MRKNYDVLIVGGGLAGNCLALALKNSELDVAIIEAQTQQKLYNSPAGDRALALAVGTVTMLEALGIWQGVKQAATAIKNIHVSDQGHFGKTRLSAQKAQVAAFGYVITARDLETHVAHLLEQTAITRLCPARIEGLASTEQTISVNLDYRNEKTQLAAGLVVGADGAHSAVRKLLDIDQQRIDYGQTALVTTVNCELPHRNTAYERFTNVGPLALLPVGSRQCAVVWSRTPQQTALLLEMSDADFICQLQQCFGYALGELTLAAPRRAFPLTLIQAETLLKGRAILIGNAAHQLHPVAGQGFNLGLRDVALLAERLIEQHKNGLDIGDFVFLTRYSQARQQDLKKVVGFTHSLVRIFSNDNLPLAGLRNLGLDLLDLMPGAKSILTQQAMGLAGHLPRIGNRRPGDDRAF